MAAAAPKSNSSPTPSLDADDPRVLRAATALLGVTTPEVLGATAEIAGIVDKSRDRGYFLPDEDDQIRVRYARFLGTRGVLLSTLESMESLAGSGNTSWERRLPAFAVALGATCQLVGGSSRWIALAESSRILRKKLDEPDARHGVPRKTFARLYRAGTKTRRKLQFLEAVSFFQKRREDFRSQEQVPELARILEMIDQEIEGFQLGSRQLFRERLAYRWFSFRRRYHSAWKNTVFEVFRWSGSLIADLRQPGVKAADAPKRVSVELRKAALEMARPGDVFVTRHDDAMSNLFLPGFWPHAALYLGTESQREALELSFPPPHRQQAADPVCFLESKKDGVRLRPADDTLEVDAFLILRPPLEASELRDALKRAIGHSGKLYDFVFDFRCSDRLACTELIYRAFHRCGPLEFSLTETGGRLCLPAEALIQQALAQGFKVVATCNVGNEGWQRGLKAELAVHNSRVGW